DVHAMTGNFHAPTVARMPHFESKSLKDSFDDSIINWGTKERLNAVTAQCSAHRFTWRGIHVDHFSIQPSAAKGRDQLRSAVARESSHLDIHSALETIRRFAR